MQNRVARDTATRLYSYLLGLRTRDVLNRAVETSERGLALARDRVELGAAARLDVLRARVQLFAPPPPVVGCGGFPGGGTRRNQRAGRP